MYDSRLSIYLTDNIIQIFIDREQKHLPIVYYSFVSENEKRLIGPQMSSALYHTRLSKIDLFGDFHSINNIRSRGLSVNDATFDNELEYYSKFRVPSVGYPANQNLNGHQKELLI